VDFLSSASPFDTIPLIGIFMNDAWKTPWRGKNHGRFNKAECSEWVNIKESLAKKLCVGRKEIVDL
jgi:hypothetical protein